MYYIGNSPGLKYADNLVIGREFSKDEVCII
jgi:hypothetical protein